MEPTPEPVRSDMTSVNRAELYEKTWAEPLRDVAPRFGMSDVMLAKICRKMAIPLPGGGGRARYLANPGHGRPLLPPLPAGLNPDWAMTTRALRIGEAIRRSKANNSILAL